MEAFLPLLFLLLWCGGNAFASAGKDGFLFLKLGVAPRQSSMGNGGVALADDANAGQWNPASLAGVRSREMSLSYASYLDSSSLSELVYAHPWPQSAVSFAVRSLDYGDVPGFDGSGTKTNSYTAGDMALSLGYGRSWNQALSWGLALKQARQTIAGHSGTALTSDWGLHYRSPEGPFSYGLSIRNVGGGAAFVKETTSLPRLVHIGAAYHGFSDAWLVSGEIQQVSDGKTAFVLGQEVLLPQGLSLRGGFRSDRDLGNGLTLGLGFRLNQIRVDYAFEGTSTSLGAVHRVGLTLRFGGATDRLYQEGLDLSRKGLYAEAILKLKEALDVNPRHKAAVRALKEAVQALTEERRQDSPGAMK